jgi:hypothetical protein
MSIVPLREPRNSHAGVFRLAFLDKVGYPVVTRMATYGIYKQNCCGSVEAEQTCRDVQLTGTFIQRGGFRLRTTRLR